MKAGVTALVLAFLATLVLFAALVSGAPWLAGDIAWGIAAGFIVYLYGGFVVVVFLL